MRKKYIKMFSNKNHGRMRTTFNVFTYFKTIRILVFSFIVNRSMLKETGYETY